MMELKGVNACKLQRGKSGQGSNVSYHQILLHLLISPYRPSMIYMLLKHVRIYDDDQSHKTEPRDSLLHPPKSRTSVSGNSMFITANGGIFVVCSSG